jgi:hypothetical protein
VLVRMLQKLAIERTVDRLLAFRAAAYAADLALNAGTIAPGFANTANRTIHELQYRKPRTSQWIIEREHADQPLH